MSSEAKHTPGPWVWNTNRPKKYDLCWLDGAGGDGPRILSMYGSGVITPDKVLIAAAPDLLDACRKALYALKGREHDGFLRDAIRKATGA